MNLDLVAREFNTMMKMRSQKTIKKHENTINQIFNEILCLKFTEVFSLENKNKQL